MCTKATTIKQVEKGEKLCSPLVTKETASKNE